MSLLGLLPRFRKARRELRSIEEREQWCRSDLDAWRLDRLNEVWRHAIEHVPYYRILSQKMQLPDSFSSLDEFSESVPRLTKEYVRENPESLLSQAAEPGWWKQTSGSTGAATRVYWGKGSHLKVLRSRYRFYQMWGVDFLDRWVWLWGNADGLAPGFAGYRSRLYTPVKDWLRNRVRLSPYDLRSTVLRDHLKRIEKFRPQALYGHGMAINLLAQEAETIGYSPDFIKAAVLTAEPITEAMRHTTERALKTAAIVEYGSIECGLLAYSHPDGTMRVREDDVILETIPRPEGDYDVLVTVLNNPSFPLIRYALGDVCDQPLLPSQQGFSTIDRIKGRSYDLVMTKSGATLHGQIFEDILDKYPAIRRWRVLQASAGDVTVLLEIRGEFSANLINALQLRLRDLVEGFPVEVSVCDALAANANGKHRTIVSEFQTEQMVQQVIV